LLDCALLSCNISHNALKFLSLPKLFRNKYDLSTSKQADIFNSIEQCYFKYLDGKCAMDTGSQGFEPLVGQQ